MENFKIVRSGRKTLAIEIDRFGCITVRAPFWVSKRSILNFMKEKQGWIYRKLSEIRYCSTLPEIQHDQMRQMRRRVRKIIEDRLPYWEKLTGLSPVGVKITSAKKRFGSCSSKGNLCFSLFLDGMDSDLVDYVILHELCHLKEMNHSTSFYSLVERYMPNYKDCELRLKTFRPI